MLIHFKLQLYLCHHKYIYGAQVFHAIGVIRVVCVFGLYQIIELVI